MTQIPGAWPVVNTIRKILFASIKVTTFLEY